MARDNGEQQTRADRLDFEHIGPADGDESCDRYVPRSVPDHGAQPRIKRPTKVVWLRDPANAYRPTVRDIEPFGDQFSRSERQKIDIARLLAVIARDHAPKLSWRNDEAILRFIVSEALPDARFVAAGLPADDIEKVVDKFLEVLWDEIERQRRFTRKRDLSR